MRRVLVRVEERIRLEKREPEADLDGQGPPGQISGHITESDQASILAYHSDTDECGIPVALSRCSECWSAQRAVSAQKQ